MTGSTDRDNLVTVDSEGHEGEWLRMETCPIPHCDAVWGKDYKQFSSHLAAEHRPEDIGLSSDGRRVATDGGTSSSGAEDDDIVRCSLCGDSFRNPWSSKQTECPDCRQSSPDLSDFADRSVDADTDHNGGGS